MRCRCRSNSKYINAGNILTVDQVKWWTDSFSLAFALLFDLFISQPRRSPRNPRGAYRLKSIANNNRPPMNRSDIFSQAIAEESTEPSDDSFVVKDDYDDDQKNNHNDDDNSTNSSGHEAIANAALMDPLERAELILRQRRQAKRLGIVLLSDEDGGDNDNDDEIDTQIVRPKKRRRLMQILSSNDEDDDEVESKRS